MPEVLTSPKPFHQWFAERGLASYTVDPAPLDRLGGWHIDPLTGNIGHRSGRFYSIEGLQVTPAGSDRAPWSQPIIVQPEIGILGILVKRFDGAWHCLMQAKMEPGNINTLQLSPTVQATRSNFTGVHAGNAVPYLDYFWEGGGRGRPLADSLQSEQGAWFLSKRNRNMVVEALDEVPLLDGFHWLPLAELNALLSVENLVNMDTRSVLSVFPDLEQHEPADPGAEPFRSALARSASVTGAAALLSRLTEAKFHGRHERRRIPLREVKGWELGSDRIRRSDGRYFEIIGVDVEAFDREVPRWSQPLLAPTSRGIVALVLRRRRGTVELLLNACSNAGTFDQAELGPTVRCAPANYLDGDPGRPVLLDWVLDVPRSQVRFDTVHSEEGGRFYHAENRYLIVEAEADAELPIDPGPDYVWCTLGQTAELLRHGNYVSMEARCLLACLRSLL